VGEAEREAAAALAHALTLAFHDDPVQRYLFPGERAYRRRGRANFKLLVRRTLEIGKVYAAPGNAGAALWIPPGVGFMDGWRGSLFGVRSLLLLRGEVRRGMRFFELLARHHPRERHWYLPVLGTAPEQQGRGFGSALLAPVLARCDAEGVPAYLESSKERNLAFYRRHGFDVTATIRVPDGPELWPMLRKPRGG
jgi:ribosomal protein S18 acetylase RimI-like enzyme